MKKEQIDEFYHLLRVASNDAAERSMDPKVGLASNEVLNILYGLTRHLLAGGDYSALVQFSGYYGQKFLLEPVYNEIADEGWEFDRVVEFGAGLSWFGRGIAARFGLKPTLFVDKRPWTLIDVVADLETQEGTDIISELLNPNDLIVMADFLHCVSDPAGLIAEFPKWPMVVLEYYPSNKDYASSYIEQIYRYGAAPFPAGSAESVVGFMDELFAGRLYSMKQMEPYVLILAEKEE